jgi:hypothetical protein
MRNLASVAQTADVVRILLLAAAMAVSGACGSSPDAPREIPDVMPSFETSTLPQAPVPLNLTQALDTLDRASSGAVQLMMRSGEEGVTIELHDSLGLWIRNNWGLYDKGALYQDLAKRGLRYPDDMSALVLTSWWRRIHGRPLDVAGQVKVFQETNRVLANPPPAPRRRAPSGDGGRRANMPLQPTSGG